MPDLYIFKAQIGMVDPVALQNQNVCIHYVQSTYYRRVNFLESIPPFQCINLGALAANGITAKTNVPNLEMPDNEFGIFRWWPLDDAQIMLFHPPSTAKWQLRNVQVAVDMNIINRDPNLVSTEIGVWQNNRPAMQATNGHATGLGAVRIVATGYRFHTVDLEEGKERNDKLVEQLKSGEQPCTHIWCSGRGIGD